MRQPQAIAHGIQQSKSLAIPENPVPLVPPAGETENQSHGGSFPLRDVLAIMKKASPMPELGLSRRQRNSFIY
jgi:hypothetical protein